MINIKKSSLLLSTCLAGSSSFLFSACTEKEVEKPNFLVIITDDQRWDQLSCTGQQVIPEFQTPNIDKIAQEGTFFTNAFVTTPISGVSRACIATGRYKSSHGTTGFRFPLSPEALDNTYHAILKNAGYHTGLFGKWGIGMEGTDRVFDDLDAWYHQGSYFHKTEDGGKIHDSEWIAGKADRFFDKMTAEKPFCLTLCFKSPHHPYQPDPRDRELFKDTFIPKRPTETDEAYAAMNKDVMEKSLNRWCYFDERKDEATREDFEKNFLRCVVGMDRAVGKIMASLEEHGLDKNTVVIFISDHGYLWGEHGLGGKWVHYEECIHVPIIIRMPKGSRLNKGLRLEQMALNIDIAPTILDMAGLKAPEVMNGKSLLPVLKNPELDLRDDFFLEHDNVVATDNRIPDSYGVRTKEWKYIRYIVTEPNVEEMYNLKEDPQELHNLINDERYKDVREELRKKHDQYKSTLQNK